MVILRSISPVFSLLVSLSINSLRNIYLRMICLIFVIIGSASSSGIDPCTALCQRDGPAICTGGSWNKNGICHAYLFRGDPARGDYCYHTGLTAATCPSSGTPVRIADAVRLLGGSAHIYGQHVASSQCTHVFHEDCLLSLVAELPKIRDLRSVPGRY